MAIACAQAKPGGPAAYSINAPSVDHGSVGNTQEHTVKGHYGQSSQSDYASQVQTAHSQSHVQRSSISNDGGLAPLASSGHGLAYGGAHFATAAAPALAYGGHYATAAAPSYSYGGHYAASAPAIHLAGGSHLGLGYGLGYSAHVAAPTLSHGYLAAAHAPVVKYAAAAAPAYAPGIIGHGIGLAAPAAYAAPAYAAHSYAAPAYTTHLAAAPVLKAAVAAPALVHTSVSGHGIHYGY
ncbi:cuticle protein 16.5 isoform X1 [Drosophila grimshawi]|uniref:cuticle protein 16.5 isoform X1 n=1 Tax=Drosophila grimshawi TaxID=7222 RepID=UPI000C86EBC4|nr:cuticle protein 16.5 isoform X1 [Drosophila grimshawi]